MCIYYILIYVEGRLFVHHISNQTIHHISKTKQDRSIGGAVGYVIVLSVCLSVCHSVSGITAKSNELISLKLSVMIVPTSRKN